MYYSEPPESFSLYKSVQKSPKLPLQIVSRWPSRKLIDHLTKRRTFTQLRFCAKLQRPGNPIIGLLKNCTRRNAQSQRSIGLQAEILITLPEFPSIILSRRSLVLFVSFFFLSLRNLKGDVVERNGTAHMYLFAAVIGCKPFCYTSTD